MEYTDTGLKKACDVEQVAIIGKIYNMQWLKNSSHSSGHTKRVSYETESINNTVKSNINEEAEERIEVSTNIVSNNPKVDQVDKITSKNLNEDDSTINKEESHSSLEIVNLPQKEMETVWNKDVNTPSTLFPNPQSLVMQRLDEQERISMSLAESIVTVQLDQFRLNDEEQNKPNDSHNETHNEWDNVHHISDLPKSDSGISNQVSSKQCHDNNNNNAKSKSQSTLETKKNVQKATKTNSKKLTEQKIKKQPGNSLKEPYNISKQGSKSKDNLLNLCNDESKTSTSTGESKKVTVGISPKFIDKYSKVNGYNKQLIMGKGTRTKEQQFFKPHFSTFNDSGNNRKSSIEVLDEKTKCITTQLKVPRNESDKRSNELDDTKKCHKVHMARTQSYNVQYNRSKPLIKSQQRYLKNVTKPEEVNSIKNTSGFNTAVSVSTENLSKKRCENQQSIMNKQISDLQSTHNISGKNIKNQSMPECSMSERNSTKSNSVPCKRYYQNLPNAKNYVERNVKDDQAHTQKFKRDSNIYRRSSTVIPTFFKDLGGKVKTEDNKKNITDNNSTKDYKVKPVSTVDSKVHCESESSRISVYPHPHKMSNGASNTNKTDTLDPSTVNNVQSVKSLNSCSNNTKDSTAVNESQDLQVSQVSCNKTEVQFVKTEQENTSNNNNSNNKTSTSNSDTKSVKFSDNVQEISVTHRSTPSYPDNSIHQNKIPTNSFYSSLQNASNTSNAQQRENHQSVQNKGYFDNNNAQYSNTTTNIQHAESDLHQLDVVQQKPEQTAHVSPQNVLPQNNNSTSIAIGNRLPYQSMPAMYLSQYNNTQNIPRKTAESTIISQNALISSTSSYNVENQNVLQNDPSNILMHNTQTSVLPPPGFHNHPITTQPNQWNLPLPDMFLFGNMMNPAPPMNMQIQNSRHVCNTDFNNMQQTSYMQQPLFYVPSMCMQSWNPLLQYPAPLFQNPPYANCSAYSNQPVQQLESPPNFSGLVKLDNYLGNIEGCKSNNIRMKDNPMDVHMRANQYRAPVPNDYQNCSQDAQLMVPFSYGITMDSMATNGPQNVHMQVSQKYAPRTLTTANYQRMPETCSAFQNNNQDSNNRKDDASKIDSECIPPMVSPRECMYYGVNYSRKTDTVQNSSLRSDVKPVTYNIHSVNAQRYTPQFQRSNTTYHTSPKELASRGTMNRGIRKALDQ